MSNLAGICPNSKYNWFISQVTPGFQGFPQIWGKSKFSIWGNPPDLGEFTFFNHWFDKEDLMILKKNYLKNFLFMSRTWKYIIFQWQYFENRKNWEKHKKSKPFSRNMGEFPGSFFPPRSGGFYIFYLKNSFLGNPCELSVTWLFTNNWAPILWLWKESKHMTKYYFISKKN